MDLKELPLLGNGQGAHWYYASKWAALLRCVRDRPPGRVLDVGAGSGYFARQLLRETNAASATCLDPGYPADWSETVASKVLDFRRTLPGTDADLVLLMDVLEHVEDDLALLRRHVEMAPPGARFVLSVPAFAWLWSPHDTFLEHRRRYTLKQLQRLAASSGLTPIRGFYFFASVFPAASVRRVFKRAGGPLAVPVSDLRDHHPWVNTLLLRLCLAEARVATANRVFGLTAFAVGEKPAGQEPRRP
ncbi:MAG TPA: class I SAM-dependent methyltransferase [Vicinamibacterales bacterium]|nr:class I SAM-dependent methyltransferase [Vicinamibacterales bacterium]